MNPSGGSVVWNLDANSKGFDSSLKKASKDAHSFGNQVNGINFGGLLKNTGDALGKIGSALLEVGKKATVAFGAAAIAGTGFAVKSAASFEQTRIGLENMLGSADSARNVLKTVSDFAASTPFEFPELSNSVKQLVAFGFSGESAVDTMKQLGDVSAAIGTPIGDLSYLMGTLKTQGRAFTIDIRQFAQRGVPIYEYLAKVLKTNEAAITDMIEAGKIGFPEVQKAFAAMTGEGGKFHGAMAKQSKSLSGLFSTLKDNIGQTARELVGISQTGDIKEGSLFDILRKSTAGLIEKLPSLIASVKGALNDVIPLLQFWATGFVDVAKQLASFLGPALKDLWKTIRYDLFPSLQQFMREFLVPLSSTLGVLMVGAVKAAIRVLDTLFMIIGPIIRNVGGLKDAVVALGIGFVGLKVIATLNASLVTFGSGLIMSTVRTVGFGGAVTSLLSAINPVTLAIGALTIAYMALNSIINRSSQESIKLNEAQQVAADTAARAAATKYQEAIRAFQDLSNAALGYLDVNKQIVEAEKRVNEAREKLTATTNTYGAASRQAQESEAVLLEAEGRLYQAQSDRFAKLNELDEQTKKMALSNGALTATEETQVLANLKSAEAIRKVMQARGEDTTAINTIIGRLEVLKQNKDIDIITKVMSQQSITDLQQLKTSIESVPTSKTINFLANTSDALKKLMGLAGSGLTVNAVPGLTKIGNNATGTDNWKGGPTWVGERGPEIVNLPRGSQVIPNNETGGQMGSAEYNIGTINISSEVDGQRWLKKLTRDQEVSSNGLVPSQGAI